MAFLCFDFDDFLITKGRDQCKETQRLKDVCKSEDAIYHESLSTWHAAADAVMLLTRRCWTK